MKDHVVFLGSKAIGYQCLLYLIQHQESLNIKISAVLGKESGLDDGESVCDLARNHQLTVLEDLKDLKNLHPIDYLISVQYHQILKPAHIALAQKLAVNLHMAPLPEYRGCNAFTFAILEEAPVFGTSLHVLDAGIDSGDVLFEDRFEIPAQSTVEALYQETFKRSIALFKTHIGDIFKGRYVRTPQAQLALSRPCGFHLRNEITPLKELDLSWPKAKIEKYVRALYMPPFDPPYAYLNGVKTPITPSWIAKNL